ncbi:hypothetical protein Goshw_029483, partial [Gossypium schwendimanii]|nr:hypothetical protein [Gossypium schwendimanii]
MTQQGLFVSRSYLRKNWTKSYGEVRLREFTQCEAIRFWVESGFLQVEVEGDTLAIIRKLQSEEEDGSEIRVYIVDAKRLC